MTEPARARGIERFLNLFTEVRPGEARTALLLALNVFLILMFFERMGDVLSALLVFAGTSVWVLQPRGFAAINALLVAGWLVMAWRVGHYYKRLADTGQTPSTREVSSEGVPAAAPARA